VTHGLRVFGYDGSYVVVLDLEGTGVLPTAASIANVLSAST